MAGAVVVVDLRVVAVAVVVVRIVVTTAGAEVVVEVRRVVVLVVPEEAVLEVEVVEEEEATAEADAVSGSEEVVADEAGSVVEVEASDFEVWSAAELVAALVVVEPLTTSSARSALRLPEARCWPVVPDSAANSIRRAGASGTAESDSVACSSARSTADGPRWLRYARSTAITTSAPKPTLVATACQELRRDTSRKDSATDSNRTLFTVSRCRRTATASTRLNYPFPLRPSSG